MDKKEEIVVLNPLTDSEVGKMIQIIRDKQVLLDRDLATLYGVETRRINEQVKRNIERFPEDFCFQLSKAEVEAWERKNLKSQIATSSWGGNRKMPYAFTEQGVAMLATILKSPNAVDVSITILRAFVAMRHFLLTNAQIFLRLERVESKQHETDAKIEQVFAKLEEKTLKPQQGLFFDGQVFDAYEFVCNLIKRASSRIILIDNYVDESVLTMLDKRKQCPIRSGMTEGESQA